MTVKDKFPFHSFDGDSKVASLIIKLLQNRTRCVTQPKLCDLPDAAPYGTERSLQCTILGRPGPARTPPPRIEVRKGSLWRARSGIAHKPRTSPCHADLDWKRGCCDKPMGRAELDLGDSSARERGERGWK